MINKSFMYGIVAGLLIALILSTILPTRESRECKEKAIQYHHAYYHPATGEFTWKKDCK